ncbi:unnamed protein product [Effrenium voratum]|uniref:Poly [ADP-ribose] polymerase n=2 Tax=Effrenium voratum TaxID=2562239 RepID=A0AA36JKZ6_9DINO|nr:unnamed protein product [Effrenium voratum]CAJ1406918.1 unnamed protein product [Effrenium voratum]
MASGESVPGLALQFSDDRFLQRVLLEAQKNGSDAGSMQRLQGMGFGPDVAKVALHVSSGDERKALELCMSGLSFVDDTVLESRAPPAPLRCYVCGQKYLTHKSLDMHLKACKRRFELRESKLPPQERCPLLEESQLPSGVQCLEQHCDLMRSNGSVSIGETPETPEDAKDTRQVYPFKLVPCEYCKRTFQPDRLVTHQRVCLHRPKPEPKRPPRRRVTLAGPPAAAIDSYSAFCSQLERCANCSRQFRREVLATHERSCGEPTRRPRRAATSPMVRSTRSTSNSLSFTPPTRDGNSSGPNSPAVAKSQSVRLKWAPEVGCKEPSCALLLELGLISHPAPEEEARLRRQLSDRLPDAKVVGVYATNAQEHVYGALRAAMAQHGAEPEERELWHGTSWAFVSKILKQGFNRSFAGRHGTLLGHATYFSSDPRYSMRFCDKKGGGQDGTKVLFASRVLVGRYCKGSREDVEPPVLNEHGDRYDSTVDNAEAPTIFAVFRDFQALPLFLVEMAA